MGSRKPGAKAYGPEWRERVAEGVRRSNRRKREAARIGPADLKRIQATGSVPAHLRDFLEASQVEAGELIEALGGFDQVSPQRRLLIEDVARVGLVMRAELARYLQSTSDTDAAARVGTLAGQRRSSLLALGLERRREELDLPAYLAQRAEAAAESNPNAPEGAQEEIPSE